MPRTSEPKPTVVHHDRVELVSNEGDKLVLCRNRTTKMTTVTISGPTTVSDATLVLFAQSIAKLVKKKG